MDTNVVVSAVATRGVCADLMTLVLAEHELVLGQTVLAELQRVLHDKLGVPKATIGELDAFLRQRATVVATPDPVPESALDVGDAAVLAEAVAAEVDALVTGDEELLKLQHSPVPIVSPRGLWERLRATPPP